MSSMKHAGVGALGLVLLAAGLATAADPKYDLLLKGGHVIDAKNNLSAVRDVAIAGGKIAAVAPRIDPADAFKTVDVSGLYVTPGLVDIHVHVFTGTGEKNSYAGDNSVYPDGFTLRVGVTTVADAGCAGWRNFEEFKTRVIDRSKTRVLAFINIVGNGMRGGAYEQDLADMAAAPTAEMAKKYPGLIIGVKTAHYAGPEWTPVEHAVEAGTAANIPVMVDFGANKPERPLAELVAKKLRPGDIYTHMYSGLRQEQDPTTLGPSKAFIEGRKRGVFFDTGTGGGSFKWSLAVPMVKDGFIPDSISTDLHIGSMNGATKDELNVASKMMAIGLSLQEVVAEMTSHPAHEIKREDLGNLSQGSVADIAVLRVEKGHYGFTDMQNTRVDGTQKLVAELTIKDGKIVYDLNGMEAKLWNEPLDPNAKYASRWTTFAPRPPDTHNTTPANEMPH